MTEQLASAGVGAGVQGSPGSTLSAPNPPAMVTLTLDVRVTMAHSRTAMRAGMNGESAAADAVLTRGDGPVTMTIPLTARCGRLALPTVMAWRDQPSSLGAGRPAADDVTAGGASRN